MKITQEQFEKQMMEEMEDLEADRMYDQQEEQIANTQELQEAYSSQGEEQQFNQHTFLANSLGLEEVEKVTYLGESELGRPLFNMRFLLDIEDISKYYIDDLAAGFNIPNKIADYFRAKINNIGSSGMSNKGFIQNLNVTRKMDSTKNRIRNLEQVKGGKA